MTHLQKTQSYLGHEPTYYWVEMTDGQEYRVARIQGRSGRNIGEGLWIGSAANMRQTYGTGQMSVRSLTDLLRKLGRKVSEVKSHNFPVLTH
jgi:hypothetical protein